MQQELSLQQGGHQIYPNLMAWLALPSKGHMQLQGLLINHFVHSGGYYPIGGASEIAFNMIPIIEKSGGKAYCPFKGKLSSTKLSHSQSDKGSQHFFEKMC